jgi:hypothetical protein
LNLADPTQLYHPSRACQTLTDEEPRRHLSAPTHPPRLSSTASPSVLRDPRGIPRFPQRNGDRASPRILSIIGRSVTPGHRWCPLVPAGAHLLARCVAGGLADARSTSPADGPLRPAFHTPQLGRTFPNTSTNTNGHCTSTDIPGDGSRQRSSPRRREIWCSVKRRRLSAKRR